MRKDGFEDFSAGKRYICVLEDWRKIHKIIRNTDYISKGFTRPNLWEK